MSQVMMKRWWSSRIKTCMMAEVMWGLLWYICSNDNQSALFDEPNRDNHSQSVMVKFPMSMRVNIGGSYTT
jgi:hypothetical protein